MQEVAGWEVLGKNFRENSQLPATRAAAPLQQQLPATPAAQTAGPAHGPIQWNFNTAPPVLPQRTARPILGSHSHEDHGDSTSIASSSSPSGVIRRLWGHTVFVGAVHGLSEGTTIPMRLRDVQSALNTTITTITATTTTYEVL